MPATVTRDKGGRNRLRKVKGPNRRLTQRYVYDYLHYCRNMVDGMCRVRRTREALAAADQLDKLFQAALPFEEQ
jgi:hypothetical protein